MDSYVRNLLILLSFLLCIIASHEVVLAAGDELNKEEVKQEEAELDEFEEEPLSKVGENIVTNATFEKLKKQQPISPRGWRRLSARNKGTITLNKDVKKGDKPSVQVWSQATENQFSYVALTQEVPVGKDRKYKLSGLLKTNLPADGKAYLNTEQLDRDKNPISSRRCWRSNRSKALTGQVNDWTQQELRVRTGANTSFIRIYLEVEQSKKGSQGSAWFTDISFARTNEKKTEHVFNGKGPAKNLLSNSRFERASERYTTFPEGWERFNVGDQGKIRLDSRVKMSGSQCVKICPVSTKKKLGCIALTQTVPVAKNKTYTVSGYIRTNRLKNAFAFLNAEQLGIQKKPVQEKRWKDNRYSKLTGTQDWTKRQVTFKTSPTTCFIRVYLEVDHTTQPTDGSAWFDHIQLERGSVSSSYNLVENSSFEREDHSVNGLVRWYEASGESVIDTQEGASGGQSVQLHRPKTTDRLKQISQVIPINQSEPAPITISGMVQGQDLDNSVEQVPNIWLGIVYDGIAQDGEYHVANEGAKAPLDDYEWQRISATIHPKKPIKQVNLYVRLGGNNTGTIWFDDLRVQQGSAVTTYEYDEKTTKITEPMGNTYQVKRKPGVMVCTDGKGNTVTYTYNEFDQLISVEPSGADMKVHYTYGDRGNIIEKKASSKNGRRVYNRICYEYSQENQLQKITDPLNHTTRYTYEEQEHGMKTRIQYADESTIEYTYDEFGRTTEEIFNGTLRYRHTYIGENTVRIKDLLTNKTKEIRFDAQNRVQKVTMTGQEIHWKYGKRGNLLSQTIQDGGASYTHQYEYNDEDQNTVIIHPNHGEYHFDYDEEGRVIIIGVPNGTSGSYDYDDNGRVTKVNLLKHDGTTIAKYTYEYDANNNRTKVTDHKGKMVRYTYDEQDQLLSETDSVTGNTISYTYDAVGNRTSKVICDPRGKQIFAVKYLYNEANQLIQVQDKPFTYDIHGNMTQDETKKYTWDHAGRLIEIKNKENTTICTFVYDEEGRRVQSIIYGKVTNYVYDGDSIDVLYETNQRNEITRTYTRSATGQLLSMTKASGEAYYYHYNAHEDVVAITDQNNQTVATYAYDAWGNILDQHGSFANENPYRYAGYRYDEATRLYYLTARYYNPRTGTFLSLDPAPGELQDMHSQNGYCYVGNNPVMQADPSGELFWFVVNAGFAAYDGYQAYKAGKGWGEVALTTAVGFVGGGRIKGAGKVVKGVKNFFSIGSKARALPRAVKRVAPKPKVHYKAKPPVRKYVLSRKKIFSGKTHTARRAVVRKTPVRKTSHSTSGKSKSTDGKSKAQHAGNGSGKSGQKKIEKGKASNPEKKHVVVVRSTQRHLSEGERQALQNFLFKARKQNSLRSVKWKPSRNTRNYASNPESLADDIASKFGSRVEHSSRGVSKGYKIKVNYGGEKLLVRIMKNGSGLREKPYIRISQDGKGALTRDGKFSSNKADTHVDITGDSFKQVLNIIKRFIQSKGK